MRNIHTLMHPLMAEAVMQGADMLIRRNTALPIQSTLWNFYTRLSKLFGVCPKTLSYRELGGKHARTMFWKLWSGSEDKSGLIYWLVVVCASFYAAIGHLCGGRIWTSFELSFFYSTSAIIFCVYNNCNIMNAFMKRLSKCILIYPPLYDWHNPHPSLWSQVLCTAFVCGCSERL